MINLQKLWSFATMTLIIAIATSKPSFSQSIEYNSHGRRVTYPNGEILYLGKSGDAIFVLSNGYREYGSWSGSTGTTVVYLSGRTIRLPSQGQSPRISGYCILKGQPVPDYLCY
jgi:hypothetical protein